MKAAGDLVPWTRRIVHDGLHSLFEDAWNPGKVQARIEWAQAKVAGINSLVSGMLLYVTGNLGSGGPPLLSGDAPRRLLHH